MTLRLRRPAALGKNGRAKFGFSMQEAAIDKPSVRSIFPTYVIETRVRDAEALTEDLKTVILARRKGDAEIVDFEQGPGPTDVGVALN